MAELLETKRYQFDFNGGEHVILAQVIFMKDSMYLYITSSDSDSCMMNMSAAMNTRFDTMPIVSHLISSENITADSWGTSIAQKLAKRLKYQVFVSCNISAQCESVVQELEQSLIKVLSSGK